MDRFGTVRNTYFVPCDPPLIADRRTEFVDSRGNLKVVSEKFSGSAEDGYNVWLELID